MADLDIEQLLAPIAAENPCGEALGYDLQFLALELAAQSGAMADASTEPDWAEVARLGAELALRSKDLRIGVLLARAALYRQGLAGLRDGLALLLGYVTQDWDGLHPRPDPEEGEDQTVRINALANLADPDGMLADLRQLPLARSRLFGTVTLRDWVEAQRGEAGTAELLRAFQDSDAAALRQDSAAAEACQAKLAALDAAIRARVEAAEAPRLDPLAALLAQIAALLAAQQRAAPVAASVAEAPAAPVAADGSIGSREDVIAGLDRICRWYAVQEPGSPVPILLQRARRLVAKDFMSLLLDLAPEAATQFRSIAGMAEDAP